MKKSFNRKKNYKNKGGRERGSNRIDKHDGKLGEKIETTIL